MSNKLENIILKYHLFIIYTIIIFIDIVIKIKYFHKIKLPDISFVLSLMPMIFTVIVLSVSYNKQYIYGVKAKEFRKVLSDSNYSLKDMSYISLIIIALCFITDYFQLLISSIYTILLAFIYSIIFIKQELPLLIEDDDILIKNIVSAKNKCINYDRRDLSLKSYYDDILNYLVLNQGIIKTFNDFKSNSKNENTNIFMKLLLMEYKYVDKIYKNTLHSNNEDNEHVESIFNDIKEVIFSFDDVSTQINNFNSVIYIITNMVNKLYLYCYKINDDDEVKKVVKSILRQKVNFTLENGESLNGVQECIIKFINILVITGVKNQNIWFLDLLFSTNLFFINNSFNKYHLIFISMYLFYISEIDKMSVRGVSDTTRKFIESNINNINENNEIFKYIINDLLVTISIDDVIQLLPNLFYFYDLTDEIISWYDSENGNLNSASSEFDESYIVRCWIELLKLVYTDDYKFASKMSNAISKIENKQIYIRNLINYEYFHNNENEMDIKKSYLSYYEVTKNNNLNYKSKLDVLIANLTNVQKREDCYKNSIFRNEKIDEQINNVINNIKNYFDFRKINILNNEPLESEDISIILEKNSFNYSSSLFADLAINTIINNLQFKLSKITKNITIVNSVSYSDYAFIGSKIYYLKDSGQLSIFRIKSKHFNDKDKVYLFNAKDIKFNIKLNNSDFVFKNLTISEISEKIDREYKTTDNLFMYYETNGNTNILSKDEIYNKVYNDYIKVTLKFKFNITIEENNIKLLNINKNGF